MAEYKVSVVRDGKGGTINFPIFISQADLDLIEKEFVVKDGDVYIVTVPRSGTTWMEQIVHLLVHNGEQGEKRLTDAVPWVETLPHRLEGMQEFLKAMRGPRLFTSHLPFPLMPKVNGTTAQYIYVARNPKDVATSCYFHEQSKLGYEGTWEEHFQLFIDGNLTFGSYFDHVLPWWEASKRAQNILFLKYEDMKHGPTEGVAKIASFLGVQADSHLFDRVVELSSFKSMSSGQNTNFDWIPQRAGVPTHYRKGDIGDWRNQFTVEQSQQLDAVFMEKMQGTGLQFDFGDGVILPN
jgi:hypothetical protein